MMVAPALLLLLTLKTWPRIETEAELVNYQLYHLEVVLHIYAMYLRTVVQRLSSTMVEGCGTSRNSNVSLGHDMLGA